jgi:hypothetical protein
MECDIFFSVVVLAKKFGNQWSMCSWHLTTP